MPTSQFLPWATGAGANVQSQSAYNADDARDQGYQPNTDAVSASWNKAVRQGTLMAAAVAWFTKLRQAANVDDDGDVAALAAKIGDAVDKYNKFVGSLNDTTLTPATGVTSQIPYDNTIPLIGEGFQIFTQVYQLQKDDLMLQIEVELPVVKVTGGTSDPSRAILAIFVGTTCVGVGITPQAAVAPAAIQQSMFVRALVDTNDLPVSAAGTNLTITVNIGAEDGATGATIDILNSKFGAANKSILTIREFSDN